MKAMVFLVFTLSGLCAAINRKYYYIKSLQTWAEAQSYCRDLYHDLATIENADDNTVITNIQELVNFVWIGLYDDMAKWKWSLGNENFNNHIDFDYWALNEPFDTRTGDSCAVMTPSGIWYDTSCAKLRFAVCYYEKGSPTYIFVNTAMTWYQARGYCRSNYTDLASVSTISENDEISSLVLADAWIGLHRTPWVWSDSSTSNFSNWNAIGSSNIAGMTSCATVSTLTGLWWEADCEEEHYFICEDVSYSNGSTSIDNPSTVQRKGKTATTTYKLKFRSDEDMNNPGVEEQILKQLHANLKTHRLPDFKLRWIQTDGQTFHKEQKEEQGGKTTPIVDTCPAGLVSTILCQKDEKRVRMPEQVIVERTSWCFR